MTANITAAPASVRVILKLDSEKPKLESVNIDNFAGFSGVADSGAGEAKILFANNTYTITGTAEGSQLNDPRVSVRHRSRSRWVADCRQQLVGRHRRQLRCHRQAAR